CPRQAASALIESAMRKIGYEASRSVCSVSFVSEAGTTEASAPYSRNQVQRSRGSRRNATTAPAIASSTVISRMLPPLPGTWWREFGSPPRSEEHTSELQSHLNLVC